MPFGGGCCFLFKRQVDAILGNDTCCQINVFFFVFREGGIYTNIVGWKKKHERKIISSPIENKLIIFLLNTLLGSSWEGIDFPCSPIVGLRTKNYIFITKPFFVWKESIFHEIWTLKMYFLREIWWKYGRVLSNLFWWKYHWRFVFDQPVALLMDDRLKKDLPGDSTLTCCWFPKRCEMTETPWRSVTWRSI